MCCSTRERVEWIGDATINIYNGTRTAFATVEDDGAVTYADHRLLYGVLKRAALSGRAPYPSMFQVCGTGGGCGRQCSSPSLPHPADVRVSIGQGAHVLRPSRLRECSATQTGRSGLRAHTSLPLPATQNAVWTDQTLAWASAFARYLAVSGDVAGVAALWPDLRAALAAVVARTQALSGLGLHRETIFFSDPLFLQASGSRSAHNPSCIASCCPRTPARRSSARRR